MTLDYRRCAILAATGVFSLSTALAAAQTPSPSGEAVTRPAETAEPAEAADRSAGATIDEDIVRFSGSVVRSMPSTRPFELRVNRWSTRAERDAIAKIFDESEEPADIAEALGRMPAIGAFRTISGQANPVRYAEEVAAPDGGRKLLILSDRQVDYWEGASIPSQVAEGYTLMEVHFEGETGQGVATHGADDVIVDEATNSLAISNFKEQAPELVGVTRLEAGEGFELDEMMDDVMDAVGIQ